MLEFGSTCRTSSVVALLQNSDHLSRGGMSTDKKKRSHFWLDPDLAVNKL